jgi:hypothetical protein
MPLTSGKEGFVNATMAAWLMGISSRHVYGLIENGDLVARHKNKRCLEIALADVEAWIEGNPREVNPLEQLKSLHEQFQQVLCRIDELETLFDAFRTSTREELVALRTEVKRDDLQQTINYLLVMLDRFSEQEYRFSKLQTDENVNVSPISRFRIDLQERVRRALSATE